MFYKTFYFKIHLISMCYLPFLAIYNLSYIKNVIISVDEIYSQTLSNRLYLILCLLLSLQKANNVWSHITDVWKQIVFMRK